VVCEDVEYIVGKSEQNNKYVFFEKCFYFLKSYNKQTFLSKSFFDHSKAPTLFLLPQQGTDAFANVK